MYPVQSLAMILLEVLVLTLLSGKVEPISMAA